MISPVSEPVPRYSKKQNPFDYFYFLRPMLHPPVWTIVILGFYRGNPQTLSFKSIIWLLLLSSGAAGWAYIVNQIADIESDRINRKLYFLPDGLISIRAAYFLAGAVALFTLIGSFLTSAVLGTLFAIGLILGYAYSGRPFWGKNKPVIGTLMNSLAHGVLPFIAGYFMAAGNLHSVEIFSLPYFFAVAAVFAGTTLPDIQGDRKIRKITPGVAFGVSKTIWLMTALLIAAMALSFLLSDFPIAIASASSLPFYLYSAIRRSAPLAITALKVSILVLSIAACLIFWPYIIVLAALLVVTRIYYRSRFKMIYPRLT